MLNSGQEGANHMQGGDYSKSALDTIFCLSDKEQIWDNHCSAHDHGLNILLRTAAQLIYLSSAHDILTIF